MENGLNADGEVHESIINIPAAQDTSSPSSSAHLYLRSPCGNEQKKDYLSKGRPLYKAAKNGNWSDAEEIFKIDPDAVRAYITEGLETSLHISALADKFEYVKKLAGLMKKDDLAIKNRAGNTALCLAAVSGNVKIAQALIREHPELGQIRGGDKTLPIMVAANLGNGAMVGYLYEYSKAHWTEEEEDELLTECISSDLFDIALKMINNNPKLAVSHNALEVLAAKPMEDKSTKEGWELYFYSGSEEAGREKSLKIQSYELLKTMLELAFSTEDLDITNIIRKAPQLLFDAARRGNFHVFTLLIDYYPELVWKTHNGLSMFHAAVEHRHESIFDLLHSMDEVRRLVTTYADIKTGDNMLHLAATLAPKDKLNTVAGAAFQMQEAIRWYQAVEKIVPPAYKHMQNNKGSTPADIFDREQKKLSEEGEKWMKVVAKSCMLVAALIATVLFTAAFTVPGGNDNERYPSLLNKVSLELLYISEVIGMFLSSTSMLMFLSILTSRVNKFAFQHSLPCILMIGVTTLFGSIVSMVIAFCTAIFLSYHHTSTGAPVLFCLLLYQSFLYF
ncbi:uncharacterized protein LOC141698216 isoform X1 [Apium graveolens]|uniref:uncharacterized protein LOC141698216 isoform X1 n=2 Tax=Apium graveolens TaxID=4045 RepID=UPI003D798AC0